MRILQARTLECVSMPSSRGSSQSRNRTQVSSIAGGFFTIWATREAPSCTQSILNWPYNYFLHFCSQESIQKLTRVPEVTSDWNLCHSSCLVSCHHSTVTSCCDERLQIRCVCVYCQNCNDYFQRNHLYSFDLFLLLFSHSVVSNSLTPWSSVCQAFLSFTNLLSCSNSCPLSQWCHPTISSSVTPFSSCPQSSPASGSFPMSLFFASGGQSIGPYLLLLIVTGFKVI